MHFWFTFHFFFVFQNRICKNNTINHFTLQGFLYKNDIELAALFWLILAKDDDKVLKQQLFNDLWQYLRIGASLKNLIDSTHFAFPIGTWKLLNLFVSCVFPWLWKSFIYKPFFFFLLVRPPRSQRLPIMVWCSSKTGHRRRRPLDSGPIFLKFLCFPSEMNVGSFLIFPPPRFVWAPCV